MTPGREREREALPYPSAQKNTEICQAFAYRVQIKIVIALTIRAVITRVMIVIGDDEVTAINVLWEHMTQGAQYQGANKEGRSVSGSGSEQATGFQVLFWKVMGVPAARQGSTPQRSSAHSSFVRWVLHRN